MPIKDEIKLSRDFANQGVHAAMLLARTLFELADEPTEYLREQGITYTQYNVLRILRGTPDGLSHRDIRERLVAKESDVSRILDKLVRDKLARRVPSELDRRVVFGQITPKGLKLINKLDEPLHELHARQFASLGPKKTSQLIKLLEELRENNKTTTTKD